MRLALTFIQVIFLASLLGSLRADYLRNPKGVLTSLSHLDPYGIARDAACSSKTGYVAAGQLIKNDKFYCNSKSQCWVRSNVLIGDAEAAFKLVCQTMLLGVYYPGVN